MGYISGKIFTSILAGMITISATNYTGAQEVTKIKENVDILHDQAVLLNDEAATKISMANENIQKKNDEIKRLQAEISGLQAQVAEAKQVNEQLTQKWNDSKLTITQLQSQLASAEAAKAALQSQLNTTMEENKALKLKIDQLNAQINALITTCGRKCQ